MAIGEAIGSLSVKVVEVVLALVGAVIAALAGSIAADISRRRLSLRTIGLTAGALITVALAATWVSAQLHPSSSRTLPAEQPDSGAVIEPTPDSYLPAHDVVWYGVVSYIDSTGWSLESLNRLAAFGDRPGLLTVCASVMVLYEDAAAPDDRHLVFEFGPQGERWRDLELQQVPRDYESFDACLAGRSGPPVALPDAPPDE